jgi:hypothetical protein
LTEGHRFEPESAIHVSERRPRVNDRAGRDDRRVFSSRKR